MFLDKLEKRAVLTNNDGWSNIFVQGEDYENLEMKESTYFKCIKVLSESVAKIPISLMQTKDIGEVKVKSHALYNLLRNRPNEYMSSIDFFKCMEAKRQHNGDAFALISRDSKGNVIGLYPIEVTDLVIDNLGLCKSKKKNKILVNYNVNGTQYSCFYSDVLHFKGFTLDGINSMSVKSSLKSVINSSQYAQSYQNDLFKNGLTNKAVVQLTSDIKDKKELEKVQTKFNTMYSSKGRIFTVPAGYSVSPLNLSLADSQFAELKKIGALEIASAFGVPAYFLNYMEGYNNNSLEQTNLSFLVDTLLILLESIEQELNYKLLTENDRKKGLYFEFNQGVLLRVSQQQQADILTKYVTAGIYTSNEARLKLGLTKAESGDDLIVNAGVLKIKDIGNNVEGGDINGEGN